MLTKRLVLIVSLKRLVFNNSVNKEVGFNSEFKRLVFNNSVNKARVRMKRVVRRWVFNGFHFINYWGQMRVKSGNKSGTNERAGFSSNIDLKKENGSV